MQLEINIVWFLVVAGVMQLEINIVWFLVVAVVRRSSGKKTNAIKRFSLVLHPLPNFAFKKVDV